MPRVRVLMRLRFTRVPGVVGERVFCAVLHVSDPDARSYQDLSDLVEKKLTFMQVPTSSHFTVFARDEPSGERVVVDDAYFAVLLRRWLRTAAAADGAVVARRRKRGGGDGVKRRRCAACDGDAQTPALLGGLDACSCDAASDGDDSGDDEDGEEVHASFDVEVTAPCATTSATAVTTAPVSVAPAAATTTTTTHTLPLTAANLAQLTRRASSDNNNSSTTTAAAAAAAATAATTTATSVAAAAEQHVSVAALTCPPACANFVLRCVVLAMRFRTPRPDVTVAELDLCDAAAPAQQITAVTFDAVVQRAMRAHLRADRRQVVELRRAYVRRKSDADTRYQTNAHPLLLRLDRTCSIEVVQLLPVPLPSALVAPVMLLHAEALRDTTNNNGSNAVSAGGCGVVRVRETMQPAGVVDLGALARAPPALSTIAADDAAATAVVGGGGGGGVWHARAAAAAALSLSSSASAASSSSQSGGGSTARRTIFSLAACSGSSGAQRGASFVAVGGNAGCGDARVVGAVPAELGRQLRSEQERYLAQRAAATAAAEAAARPVEPGGGAAAVTQREVRQREPTLVQHANKEAERKARIRRRAAVQQRCLLCDLDCDDEDACMAAVRRLLEANARNRGKHVPTMSELRDALSDRRRNNSGSGSGSKPARLVCRSTFVNMHTRSVHVVHCRCAHLCTSYQRGNDLEDLVLYELPMQVCALCGMTGAIVNCYHPDCNEAYHVVCALFSGGYVNFGKKDPHLPCPACPRHTLVNMRPRAVDDVLHVDRSCWDDGIAFDSRVVEDGDLRDPDENDGA